jgi:hypothetical protein
MFFTRHNKPRIPNGNAGIVTTGGQGDLSDVRLPRKSAIRYWRREDLPELQWRLVGMRIMSHTRLKHSQLQTGESRMSIHGYS